MPSENHPDLLARSVAGIVACVARHPRAVLIVAFAITCAAIFISLTRLEYHTQRNDLLSADKPCQQRWQRYLDAFGEDDDLVVIAEGTNREQMTAALDAVAVELKQHPDLFDRVFHKVELNHLRNRAILHLPIEELEAIAKRLDRMAALIGPVAPVAWRMLSLQSLLGNGAIALEAESNGRELTPADRDLLAQLPAVMESATATLNDPATYHNPWRLADTRSDHALTEPQYIFTPDGSLALLTCRVKKAAQSFTPAKESSDTVREILARVGPAYPDVTLGLTGLPVLESDEMEQSQADSTRAAWLALAGVALLYAIVYRRPRYPLLTITTLVVGTLWALGWTTLTIGHLNILSSAFAVMLIGLGDYGVLWVARYDEARRQGESVNESLRLTALRAGPSILTASATTGLAFFAIMLADFKAVAELGWIAGCGVLLCAASCVLLMPALLVLVDRRSTNSSRVAHAPGLPTTLPFPSAFLPITTRHPRLLLGVAAVLLLACGLAATRLEYDHNLLNLQPRKLDSVKWEHKLIDRAAGATWDAMSIAHSREEALTLKASYEAIPEVGRVVEVASFIPADQERKLPVVRAIHQSVAEFPPPGDFPQPVGSDPLAVRSLAAKIAQLAPSDSPLSLHATQLCTAIESCPYAVPRLRTFDRKLGADLATELTRLKDVSHPAPITTDDIPPALRERYVGANGEFLVRAFARDSLWDYDSLKQFTTAAQTVDPEGTGKSFRTLEGLRQMKRGFEWAAVYAVAAIVFVLLLDLRQVSHLMLVLFPLAVGVVLTLGVMAAFGVPLNPANMIALPLVVGVGVDNGVHVLHDYRGRDRKRLYRLGTATGRGVLVAALTTILGFGTLMTARHEGMASLGLALTLGVTFCLISALALLPAVLHLLDRRRLNQEREVHSRAGDQAQNWEHSRAA